MSQSVEVVYDDRITAKFIWASVLFGIVGMLVGVLIATQLAFFQANFGISFLSFGRLRPLHTNAVIFAFVGNMLFAGVYYSTQRLLKTRMASDLLSTIHFWGWQLIIVAAAISLPLGYTQGKEYAELEWPIDIAIALIWVVFAVNFFWTLAIRRERQLYVALWFYIATIITVAVLHIVNALAMPSGLMKSYPLFAGVQGALVQWWYGHNAVAFFLTTPILGIMYYFLPKAANRPVYSYRLSLVHFWSLVFLYIWAGPHHLLYTALPDWAQSLGVIFSLMLWAPSWGGMINGLMTLKGSWNELRTDPILKFFAAGVTFYGMATFEGPLLSIKGVSALAHYTDWIIGHVHSGALGWNGFMAAGMFYWLIPRLYGKKELYSKSLADIHFWLATFGIVLYVISMWASGITQGLMLKATTPTGALAYPSFVETIQTIQPFYIIRLIGGSLYFVGFLLMAYNLVRTAAGGKVVDSVVQVQSSMEQTATPKNKGLGLKQIIFSKPIAIIVLFLILGTAFGVASLTLSIVVLLFLILTLAYTYLSSTGEGTYKYHQFLEGKAFAFTLFVLLAVLIGGIAEFIPALALNQAVPTMGSPATQVPYSPLQIAGRDIYVREGCYNCHSQMIRHLVEDTTRYGSVSLAEEFIYDRPYQWGSKRTGPDLHRLGKKYPHSWHYQHMLNPQKISAGSNMPSYTWLLDAKVNHDDIAASMRALASLGTPYTPKQLLSAKDLAIEEATAVKDELQKQGITIERDSELVALIAYLQSLGLHPSAETAVVTPSPSPAAAEKKE